MHSLSVRIAESLVWGVINQLKKSLSSATRHMCIYHWYICPHTWCLMALKTYRLSSIIAIMITVNHLDYFVVYQNYQQSFTIIGSKMCVAQKSPLYLIKTNQTNLWSTCVLEILEHFKIQIWLFGVVESDLQYARYFIAWNFPSG